MHRYQWIKSARRLSSVAAYYVEGEQSRAGIEKMFEVAH